MSDLFAHARRNDPSTSKEAADSVRRIKESQQHILDVLKAWGPQTDEEIYARLMAAGRFKISPSGARTRRSELVADGRVKDSGAKAFTKSNRRTIIWSLS